MPAVELFIQDLAVIMLIAGVVTVVFNRFKQPVVLGYIVAGIIIGPYTPPFQLIQDEHTIHILSELGVIFLLFSLGLEFSLKTIHRPARRLMVWLRGLDQQDCCLVVLPCERSNESEDLVSDEDRKGLFVACDVRDLDC